MATRLTRISATVALLLALAAALGLALWPCAYRGVEAESGPGGVVQERQVCATLIEVNGAGALGVLALPVLLAGVGLLAAWTRRRGILAIATLALIAFCVAALASVGLLYVPAAGALVVAMGSWRQPRRAAEA
ncbi:MAG TPA: hypothetical protein VF512_00790 [Actinomycetota bacterium]